ncbi:uncharacterized protein FFUJ_09032 [Fusarium fujikuroi IMI 58289]|uniref:Uncharacterized protein n=1 Tax=Gibberella fujikuroi (strain CBS 195.34 / IMI 58289 / NRRL A-6831) TaxID=1279085 RepID=S0E7U6_GIBF5|nr:uncharacterized protein FFUJ_09032 [Fusarium fujikuroi IMI 58289]QGI66660.1 hypothetical protein CEK27_010631 [Fusarium fujikuroi]QGI83898.1 hypothetical protein CEK25_010627 [Fusarium fujikuroi]QGI97550.1 hypothetical protein CEK26_010619 [Fusarium fujikuroi]CCT70941.1 uncharacterized protein FFUJ_09032 [Fusarium fujikuroi IMI 58289]SCO02631.1 uncharacterized protein FFM5_07915 [Fusarium fujikuroi]
MSTNLLSELKQFLGAFLRPNDAAEGEPAARFAHIQMPPYRLGKEGLMNLINNEVIHSSFAEKAGMNLFVVPESEKSDQFGAEHDVVSSQTLTFSALLDALRITRQASGSDLGWGYNLMGDAEADFRVRNILPLSVVLVLQLDPEMSADCALSLIGIVQWALFVSTVVPFSNIRVLTVSVDEDANFLSKLVHFSAPDIEVASMNLAAHGEQNPDHGSVVFKSHSIELCVEKIRESLESNKDRRLLVLSFDADITKPLIQKLGSDDKARFKIITAGTAPPDVNAVPAEKSLILRFPKPVSFLPLEFQGFDELHVFLSSKTHMAQAWDNISCQVIEYSRPLSREDRRLQYWWARQPSMQHKYLYFNEPALSLFLEAGGSRARLVETSQLGGFIAAVMDIMSWGFHVDKVLNLFIRKPLEVQEMRTRLQVQGLINPTGLALIDSEASVFRRLLSTFRYDYRLSMFVALDSDAQVRRVKLELATMQNLWVANMISIKPGITTTNKLSAELFEGCLGLSSSLARRGVLWLNLGLLKQHLSNPDKFKDYLVFNPRAKVVDRQVAQMLKLLPGQSESNDQRSMSEEVAVLSAEQERVLQKHLLRAFLYQLTLTYYPKVNGTRNGSNGFCHNLVSSMAKCDIEMLNTLTLINFKALYKKEGSEVAFGICHGLFRPDESRRVSCKDWTLIPAETVHEWLSEVAPEGNIFEVLHTGIQHFKTN